MELEYKQTRFRKENRVYVCPYNEECRCVRIECYKCGWNPKVAERRREALAEKMGGRGDE